MCALVMLITETLYKVGRKFDYRILFYHAKGQTETRSSARKHQEERSILSYLWGDLLVL